jgi:membrane protein
VFGFRRRSAEGRPIPGVSFNRTTAFGLGVFLGLSTVLADGLWPVRRPPGRRQRLAAPEKGLPPLVKRTWQEFSEDRIPAVAAGAAFYALLALFPALGVFVSLYGLVADVGEARRHIAALSGVLPQGGIAVLSEQMTRLAAAPQADLGLTFVVSLLLSVWSSNAGIKAVIAGLNIAYEQKERRGVVALNLVSLAFTAGSIIFAMLAIGAVAAVPGLLGLMGWGGLAQVSLLRWPALLLVTAALLSVLYRFAPSHEHARWRWITPGGAFAATAWAGMSLLFSIYVGHFGHYDKTYGSLGALAGFMTWIWLSLMVILLGAELNCELDRAAPKAKPT